MANMRLATALIAMGNVAAAEQPFWGCGMTGDMPGISKDGNTSAAMQTLIDGLKATNKYDDKVSYWNWNFAPVDTVDCSGKKTHQYLTKDFVFMPDNWGVGVVDEKSLRDANITNFVDGSGLVSPATMADLFLGSNEPDIIGGCTGDMMGTCTAPCKPGEEECPVGHICGEPGSQKPNEHGRCNCYSDSSPSGVGFWPMPGVSSPYQPLPTCWDNQQCIDALMGNWRKTAAIAVGKGYKYLSAPLVAVHLNWTANFLAEACKTCSDISCGCPSHIGWHYYANDCQPENGGTGYASFQAKLDFTVQLMEKYPHLQGAIVNEVGMLNCAMANPEAQCVPNGPDQKYQAKNLPNHACPSTPSLPKGLGSFIEQLLHMVSLAKTSDGRRAVVSFTWFQMNMRGGTYNLRLFDDDGNLNQAGESYISACQAWANASPGLAGSRSASELIV